MGGGGGGGGGGSGEPGRRHGQGRLSQNTPSWSGSRVLAARCAAAWLGKSAQTARTFAAAGLAPGAAASATRSAGRRARRWARRQIKAA